MLHPHDDLALSGFELTLTQDGNLMVRPSARLTPELREFVRLHKASILERLANPPAIPHFGSGVTAEAVAAHASRMKDGPSVERELFAMLDLEAAHPDRWRGLREAVAAIRWNRRPTGRRAEQGDSV